MKILGIDPGSRVAGYALIEQEGRRLKYITSGIMKFDQVSEFIPRLALIKRVMLEVMEELKPDHVALESLIYVKSPTALMKLAQARGVMLSVIGDYCNEHIFEYSPNLVKSTTSGHGHASKASIEKSIKLLLNEDIKFQKHDESDAAAVAITHALHYNPIKNSIKEALKDKKGPLYKSKKGLANSLGHLIK